MSVKEFWDEEPNLLWAYRKSYMDEKNVQSELANYNAWLNGLYVFDAINTSLYNNFGRKGQEPKHYIEKPYDFNKSKEDIEKERQIENEENIKQALMRMKKALN